MMKVLTPIVLSAPLALAVPMPNPRQLAFMESEMVQFMHFGIPTFWDAPESFLRGSNPTFHDCSSTSVDNHTNQTGAYWPCLDPIIFAPADLDADAWMASAKAMGMKEICLTAHHEGGFALWPSNFTEYSVARSLRWRGGRGDVLREFADAANRWGVGICYYLNVAADGYEKLVANSTADAFLASQLGMVREVLRAYGPVNRFWFDGSGSGVVDPAVLWPAVYELIRGESPATLISPYRGDVCASTRSLYTSAGPAPNSTADTSGCAAPSEDGGYFHPTELHGITMQEGPDGNTPSKPTCIPRRASSNPGPHASIPLR